jgi:hypothetical protein
LLRSTSPFLRRDARPGCGGQSLSAAQTFGLATGIQSKFNWAEVGTSFVAGGVGGAVQSAPVDLGDGVLNVVEKGAVSSVIAQGADTALGLQHSFSWTHVAVAGVMAGAGREASSLMGAGAPTDWRAGAANVIGAVAGAGIKSAIEGSDFAANLQQLVPQAVGQTIGELVAGAVQRQASDVTVHDHYAGDGSLRGQLAALDNTGLADAVNEVSEVVVKGRQPDWLHRYIINPIENFFDGSGGGVDGTFSNFFYYQPPSDSELSKLRQDQAQFSTMVATQIDPIGQFEYNHPRIAGGIGVVTDVVGLVGGVGGGMLTSETGFGAIAGGMVAYTSLSNLKADWSQLTTGQRGTSLTYDISRNLGASPAMAQGVDVGSNMLTVGVGGVAGGGRMFSTESALAKITPLDFTAEGAVPSIEAQFQANSLRVATEAHEQFWAEAGSGDRVLNPNLNENIQAGKYVDQQVRLSNQQLANELGLDSSSVKINQRLYMPNGNYSVPDLYFPKSGNIVDYSYQLKTIDTPQIQQFISASPNGTITIIPPAQVRSVYKVGP